MSKETNPIMVEALVLRIGGGVQQVTIEDARRLHAALNELFRERDMGAPYPVPYPVTPWPFRWWETWSESPTTETYSQDGTGGMTTGSVTLGMRLSPMEERTDGP